MSSLWAVITAVALFLLIILIEVVWSFIDDRMTRYLHPEDTRDALAYLQIMREDPGQVRTIKRGDVVANLHNNVTLLESGHFTNERGQLVTARYLRQQALAEARRIREDARRTRERERKEAYQRPVAKGRQAEFWRRQEKTVHLS